MAGKTIVVDHGALSAASQKLGTLADGMDGQAKSLSDASSALLGAWEGGRPRLLLGRLGHPREVHAGGRADPQGGVGVDRKVERDVQGGGRQGGQLHGVRVARLGRRQAANAGGVGANPGNNGHRSARRRA